jgi:uncharacterized membrane protein
MNSTRLEIFSDAVIAIAMTIMVLELQIPHGNTWAALSPLIPTFLAYVLSYVYLAIYWNNHHHMLAITDHIDGHVMWANLHLLFWLSLIPFATGWMSESGFSTLPTALYGTVLLMGAISYFLLQRTILAHCDANQRLREAVQGGYKGKASLALYTIAVPLAFWNQWASVILYVAVAFLWLVPDKRIEEKAHGHVSSVHS